jgi:putative membrane-bound dehydrogenase-like protein
MTTRSLLVGCLLVAFTGTIACAAEYFVHSFERRQLTEQFTCEGATAADIDKDGHVDLIAGPYWYAGPEFTKRSEIYPPQAFDINGYSDNFVAFAHDFNGDQWLDVLVIGFPGKDARWYENPKTQEGHWQQHVAFPIVDNESPTFADLTGDGQPELVFHHQGQLGYAEYDPSMPAEPWKFYAISPDRGYQMFNHGLGVGDVNGDGRADLLERQGWWAQPAKSTADGHWEFHPVAFTPVGGAQMYAYDFDGDGDNDIISSKAAHAYGLAWFENISKDGKEFREHLIMGERPEENEYGVAFSQLHAIALADIDNDGVADIVTGKRFWAHQEHDPGSLDPAVSYWFQTVREHGKVRFVPHQIDANSGVGTQVVVADLNNDKWLDVVVGNKKGTFALVHHAKAVDENAWQKAQPQPTTPVQLIATSKASQTRPKQPEDGYQAKDASGRVINLDFEAGDARDWTAVGSAFDKQPIWGDTVHPRRNDSVSGHRGNWWVGTFEVAGDEPQGTFTSAKFVISHPYATLLVGGGSEQETRVEVVLAESEEVVFTASGRDAERMQPVVADLRKFVGKEAFLRIVDAASKPWGHINYDHFRFWDTRPQISNLSSGILQPDEYPHSGLSAGESISEMILPEGFSAQVFAAEPDVKQPIAMTLDNRGRVWIAEAYEYPVRAPEGEGHDRILIFEDADGDGRFDKRTVFAEGLNLVSGLEVGFGGVWVGAAPYFLFIPDRNGDDVPDGKPEILLDGWGFQDTHETLNSFIWGPDGWLYGCHGVFTHSRVGKPGTLSDARVPLNAAIWRYHPTRHEFEVFAHGTSNPWGVDFDDHGQAVATACVIPHLFHIIQGGRYHRQAGEHFNRYTYDDIKTIADHFHYLGDTPHSGNAKSDQAGGGHAHAGAMFYLGGAWPDEYRSRIVMNNIHGQRLNTDIIKTRGSGLVGSHGPDFLRTQDRASQMLNFRYGPDGQVYVIDWYDMQACHDGNRDVHDRSNGRIYKVTYGEPKPTVVDLDAWNDLQLAEAVLEKNDWYVRHARRILQERAAIREIDSAAIDRLGELAATHADETRRLRAMWALHVTVGIPEELTLKLLDDTNENEYVRAWALQLACDGDPPNLLNVYDRFMWMADIEESPVVRLYLASAIQRLPVDLRWTPLSYLVLHSEDENDHNLPLMYWYAAEPLAEADPSLALKLALSCGETIPLVRDFMLRRIASLDSAESLAILVDALANSTDANEQLAILSAIRQALEGQRLVKPPAAWSSVYQRLAKSDNEALRTQATALGIKFGDENAFAAFREIVSSYQVDVAKRREALSTLLEAKDSHLAETLQSLLAETALRDLALNGLALYENSKTPAAVLATYNNFSPEEKQKAIATLSSRASYALALLQAIQQGTVPKSDLSADLARQLHNLQNEEIDTLLTDIWGQVRTSVEDKLKLMADYRKLLASLAATKADAELGRAVFNRTCQQCHTLYGVGNEIGPDLTGSNRADAEYLLTNIVDPSALITKEYQSSIIITDSGRVITGIVTAEDDKSITVRNTAETLVVPKDEIEEQMLSESSMMPDNQLTQFSEPEILALFAYLRGKQQVPMLAAENNATLLFNGRDLEGWNGDKTLWSVEQGEIVGKTEGLPHNSFLLSDMSAEDFHLTVEVMLKDNAGNSGIQFRSQPLNGFEEVQGYQADIGVDWWGKLYEEHGRELLWKESGEKFVVPGEWNKYEIRAEGGHIQSWINGNLCVDLDDPQGKRRGIFALQLHAGGPTEVRFRNFELKILPTPPLKAAHD